MRLLVLYARSRQVPAALLVSAAAVAALALLASTVDGLAATAGVLAVVAATAVAGPGVGGADLDLDTTAAVRWPPRRGGHALLVAAVAAALVAAAGVVVAAGPFAPTARVARDAAGMAGLVALGAAVLGAGRAWIAPVAWTLTAWTLLPALWAPPADAAYQRALTWMTQPAGSRPAALTAAALWIAGTLTYAVRGPRRR